MSLINPTLNGRSSLDTYAKVPPCGKQSEGSVHDSEIDSLQALSGPQIPRKVENRNLELRNSVMALAHVFCPEALASENWSEVFQSLHDVHREVSAKEWESIFDGRTPLSLERKDKLRIHLTGEAFNRSFTMYPPPTDHPVVRRLNQVKWDLFWNPEIVDRVPAEQPVAPPLPGAPSGSGVSKVNPPGREASAPQNIEELDGSSSSPSQGEQCREEKGAASSGDVGGRAEVAEKNGAATGPQAASMPPRPNTTGRSEKVRQVRSTSKGLKGDAPTEPKKKNENVSLEGVGVKTKSGSASEKGDGVSEEGQKNGENSDSKPLEEVPVQKETGREDEELVADLKRKQKELLSRANIFSYIAKWQHDEDFTPSRENKPGTPVYEQWLPTDAPAGSVEKVAILTKRVELGQHLWHDDDRVDYSGLWAMSLLYRR